MGNYKTLKEIYDDVESIIYGSVFPKYFSKKQNEVVVKMFDKMDELDQVEEAEECWKLLDEAVIEIYRLNK